LLYPTRTTQNSQPGSRRPAAGPQRRRRAGALILLAVCLPFLLGPAVPAVAAEPLDTEFFLGPPFELQEVTSFVLMEAHTGQILAARNANKPLGPASLTKIMTLKLALEALEAGTLTLEETALVSEKAWRTGGSKMFVLVDSRVTIRDLLYGIAVSSGNDAAVVLAEHLAGDEAAFVQRMNERARQLGLENTVFKNAHGLPAPGQMTTALDMARLARAFVRDHPEALTIMSTRAFTYQPPRAPQPITQYNRNGLLWKDPRVNGLKTGHTREAGYHLVATAEEGEMFLIAVIMGAAGQNEAAGSRRREAAASKLLDYGFRNFRTRVLDWTRVVEPELRVWKGRQNSVRLTTTEPTRVTYVAGREEALEIRREVPPSVDAPIEKGARLGTLTIAQGGKVLRQFDLVAAEAVARGSFFKVLLDALRQFLARLFSGE